VRLAAVLISALLASGCSPDSYPVPPQHNHDTTPDRLTPAEHFRAADPDAATFIVNDVQDLEGGAYRWTSVNPEFRFHLANIEGRRFRLEFGINPEMLRDIGAFEMTIEVNGHALDHAVFKTAGNRILELPVPADWLVAKGENRVRVRVHNPWPVAGHRTDLGFIFLAAGFE
jgi:hypothetical protein